MVNISSTNRGGILNGKDLVGENCNEYRVKEINEKQSDLSTNETVDLLKKANAELMSKLSKPNIENGD